MRQARTQVYDFVPSFFVDYGWRPSGRGHYREHVAL